MTTSPSEYQIPSNNFVDQDSTIDKARQEIDELFVIDDKSIDQPLEKERTLVENPVLAMRSIDDEIEEARSKKILKLFESKNHHIEKIKSFSKNISRMLFSNQSVILKDEDIVRRNLISEESQVGVTSLGLTTTKTHRYEFFYEGKEEVDGDRVDHWFYHEDIPSEQDSKKDRQSRTLHYQITKNGIMLVGFGYLEGENLDKFLSITKNYKKKIIEKIYSRKDTVKHFSPKVVQLVFKKTNKSA